MSSEWTTSSLLDHYEVRSGLSKPAKDFGSGYPFLTFKDVFYNYFTPESLGDLVQSTQKEREGCSVLRGDVFLTRTSETMHELGMSCVALRDYKDATFNGFCKRLRPKPESDLLPEYVGYYLRSPRFRQAMLAMSTMSTRASLNNEMIGRLVISFPSRKSQAQISEVLKSLDDRITVLRETNATLEAIAQALFKSWFVDFDPVRAKMAGRAPEGMDEATAALFPDALEETELGVVPKGWAVQTLGKLLVPKRGKSITKSKCLEGDVPVVAGGLEPAYFHNQCNVSKPVVTISASGANAGFVRLYQQDIWASDCSFVSAEQTDTVYFWYVFLKSNQEKIYFMQQGAAQPHIYPSDLIRMSICTPDSNGLRSIFDALVSPFFERIGLANAKIQTLSRLRDTLLPRLISGQLRLPEAQAQLEDALV